MCKQIQKFIVIIKAILTRIIFATHGFVAIWRVTVLKKDPYYWYLCASILALLFEGIFTLTIKKNQEWKWFCPSIFFYLSSVVPAIWLLEVHNFDEKLRQLNQVAGQLANATKTVVTVDDLDLDALGLNKLGLGVKNLKIDAQTWMLVIEQLLMLILIIGRWMLPKGGLTKDQLSQLLLVYIGTAADIIEFFDTFKNDEISREKILCLLILSIWSWSLLQFTFVLTATKARRTRITADIDPPKPKFVNGIYKVKEVCCSIDVWGILINIILQDAPFLIFRVLLIAYYRIISYMNVFFTAKNTLVIILQFYRLYVVQQEKNKELTKMAKATVSGNLAIAVERAAFMGPTAAAADSRAKGGRFAAASKKAGSAAASSKKLQKQGQQGKKHRSQDSISSQKTSTQTRILDAVQRERAKTGRRKSLSTGNLPEECEDIISAVRPYEDDLEIGMSESVLSGTNDGDSQEESEAPLDEISFTSEIRPVVNVRKQKKTRISENPGIYKISGSRSSEASSQQGQGRCRQDTGYSSSSKDSASSNKRGRVVNGGSRTGRGASTQGGNRSRPRHNPTQRRRQMLIANELNSIEFGGILQRPETPSSVSDAGENERIFQRRAAICVVFSLFVVIFILCMLAIYGGINPKGLVLRETFRVANSTKPKTTPSPPTNSTTDNLLTSTTVLEDIHNFTESTSFTSPLPSLEEFFSSSISSSSISSTAPIVETSSLAPAIQSSDFVRHSRHKMRRLHGYLQKEFSHFSLLN